MRSNPTTPKPTMLPQKSHLLPVLQHPELLTIRLHPPLQENLVKRKRLDLGNPRLLQDPLRPHPRRPENKLDLLITLLDELLPYHLKPDQVSPGP